jgi:hypothetical protein
VVLGQNLLGLSFVLHKNHWLASLISICIKQHMLDLARLSSESRVSVMVNI